MILIILKIALSILVADFMTGIVHWWEDAYGNPNWKLIGTSVIVPNLRHHQFPREITRGTYWSRINTSLVLGGLLAGICWVCSILNWYTFLTLAIAVHGAEIHRLAHQTDKENGRLITMLQKTGLLVSRRHHGLHHEAPYECRYCCVTNFVNPVLDYVHFWSFVERSLRLVFGIKVLRGSEVRKGL